MIETIVKTENVQCQFFEGQTENSLCVQSDTFF